MYPYGRKKSRTLFSPMRCSRNTRGSSCSIVQSSHGVRRDYYCREVITQFVGSCWFREYTYLTSSSLSLWHIALLERRNFNIRSIHMSVRVPTFLLLYKIIIIPLPGTNNHICSYHIEETHRRRPTTPMVDTNDTGMTRQTNERQSHFEILLFAISAKCETLLGSDLDRNLCEVWSKPHTWDVRQTLPSLNF